MSGEFDPTAYRLTTSAWMVINEACYLSGWRIDIDSMIYDLTYRGARAAEYLLQVDDDRPMYSALCIGSNHPLQLDPTIRLSDQVADTKPSECTLRIVEAIHTALASNQLPEEYRPFFSLDRQVILSQLAFIGKRAHVITERTTQRPVLWIDKINVPTRINLAQSLDQIGRDLLSS